MPSLDGVGGRSCGGKGGKSGTDKSDDASKRQATQSHLQPAKWQPAKDGTTPGFKPLKSGPPDQPKSYYSKGQPYVYCATRLLASGIKAILPSIMWTLLKMLSLISV